MVLGKKVAIFNWERGRNSAPREEQKIPSKISKFLIEFKGCLSGLEFTKYVVQNSYQERP